MTQAMMSKIDSLWDTALTVLMSFTDYFIVKKHITLSEGALFTFMLTRSIWFSIFGVNIGPNMNGPGLTSDLWLPLFWFLTAAHTVSFFLPHLRFRIGVLFVYSGLWIFLATLVALSSVASPALPTFVTFSFLSAFIAIRLERDKPVEELV